jgi:Fe-S oxidoreductase
MLDKGKHDNFDAPNQLSQAKAPEDQGALAKMQLAAGPELSKSDKLQTPSGKCPEGFVSFSELKGHYKTPEGFLKQSPIEMRANYGLASGASSDELFAAMGKEAAQVFKNGNSEVKALMRSNYGLNDKEFTPDKVTETIIANERKRLNLPKATLSQLEDAITNDSLNKLLQCKMPIDTN